MATPISGTAKIYAFPPRGRYALRMQDDALVLPANVKLPQGAAFAAQGSGWYHEEAVADSVRPELNRKN
jgi:hypothetical protein